MHYGISLPQSVGDNGFDPAAFRAFVTRAEELGFESAWTQEQILGTKPTLGPVETMTYAAACTERLRLGCSVFVAPLYSPAHLAKSLSSLDQLSGGRVEVGLGSGGTSRMFSAFGIDGADLGSRFTEWVRLVKALWTESRIDFDGRFWQLENAAMEPKPAQKPHPPLWFGGSRPPALRRAVEHGDGFFGAGSSTTEKFAEQVKFVREELGRQDRDPASFRIAKRVYVGVGDDPERARERVTEELNRIYGFHGVGDLTPVAVYGPPEDCVRGLREVIDAGAEMILFTPLFDDAEQMERLVAEVVPGLS